MRRISTVGLAAMLIALGQAGRPSPAQETNPPGSYTQTCTDISVKKGDLHARCQDEKGRGHSTRLSHYERCTTDIANKNGNLQCTGSASGGASSGAPGLPRGSYTETCRDITMKGSTLHAVCRSFDGREAPTSLRDANHCAQGIVNLNGILNCEVSDVLPPGSYIATCKDVRMQGTTLHATCDNGKDHWIPAELRDAHKCSGDIANMNGTLRCTAIKKIERR